MTYSSPSRRARPDIARIAGLLVVGCQTDLDDMDRTRLVRVRVAFLAAGN
jgi:hypothetical protein